MYQNILSLSDTLLRTQPMLLAAVVVLVGFAECRGQEVELPVAEAGSDQSPVESDKAKPSVPSVLIIFDCSGSMSRPTSGLGRRTRIELMREQLIGNLKSIEPRQQIRIGLMLYGHRVGWKKNVFHGKRFHALMINKAIDRQTLHPALDVETVVPIKQWNNRSLDTVLAPMRRAKPWGQTPLFYSIDLAMSRFDTDSVPNESPRYIIVMTDGENDPGPLPAAALAANGQNTDTSFTNLTLALKNQAKHSLQIDIVAFDFNVGRELKSLAEISGGEVYEVHNTGELGAALKHVLPLSP